MKKIIYDGERQRLDMYVSGLLGISRAQAQKRIKSGDVKVGGKSGNPSKIITQGDIVIFSPTDNSSFFEEKAQPKVKIIHEDENIIVVDKQAGVVVHPSEGHESGTLLDALRGKINIQDEERPGVVHRIDKDTSGIMVFAKNPKSLEYLQKEILERKFEKVYLALVWGRVEPEKGRIEIPIKRAEKDRKKMEAAKVGRESLTEYEVLKYYENMSFIKVRIITGRTHQIRVHFSAIGYPVVGDKTYGQKGDTKLARQFLHAHELSFDLFGEKYHFKSDLPDDLKVFLDCLDEKE